MNYHFKLTSSTQNHNKKMIEDSIKKGKVGYEILKR